MTATTEFGLPTVVVTPGQETSTTMTVRNDSDIVEAYEFEVVGECAPWTVVEPERLSLYPGTTGEVAVRLRPPRSPAVRAGEIPLGVRVLPAERPESVVVTETTVVVQPFAEQRAELVPERRRAWRSARYHVELHNAGNTPVSVALSAPETDDRLTYTLPREAARVEPGDRVELELRVRVGKVLWFGKPEQWPLRLDATATGGDDTTRHELEGELIQLPVFPRWLLALLAALLALLLAWLLLVRPAVRSAAREAADDRAREIAQAERVEPSPEQPSPEQPGGEDGRQPGGQGQGQGRGQGQPGTGIGGGRQSSETVEVHTGAGAEGVGAYTVPDGKVFRITDLLVGNHQGDEGVLVVAFGERKLTPIALETFRNQDYHWVTPIDVPQGASVTATVTCGKPGTPANGQQAPDCFQVVHVSGELGDLPDDN
ncbi:COG1470 family protein [Saccharothrix obliqua]|uniref:COG1470 family protein n=1 Tax=Saccharothrix obliqua TaxID=2861747 RepID=UPI001C5EA8CF|nr:hydrolytic protein [Saccharothrix obliqua]MBW4720260.1 hydrolytic protein [Saccharothrix obliqua]